MHVDLPEGGQGGCYAVQFILKSCAFLSLTIWSQNLAFENQVFVDEFFRPIQPFGISDLQTRTERRFLNAAGRPCSQSCTWLYAHRA